MGQADIQISTVVKAIAQQLTQKYKNEALCMQYAWWALEAITHKKKAALIMQPTALTQEQEETVQFWIKKQIEENIPLAYLIGSVPFISTEILVQPPILIPRQETEEWCAHLIEQLKQLPNKKLRILDMCTGSGCIAVSIAKELPEAEIYASDICEHAIVLAQKNAEHNGIHSISFLSSDLLRDFPESLTFDLIISNPPYISCDEWHDLDPSVKDWEDNNALLASENGMAIVRQLIEQAKPYIRPNVELAHYDIPQLIVEIGHTQGATVKALFEKEGFRNVSVQKDLHGNDRIVSGCVNEKVA